MSAIAGAIHVDGREISDALLGSIAAAAPVRGFDGVTRWHAGPAGLIRFAHATTPEAVGEVQPFTGDSGTMSLFDGRLDNRAELLALLGRRGEPLAMAPDGAIALALFEAMGRDFVHRLAGDFAIAIWQPDDRRLSLFRSAMGWRPLVWTLDKGTFGFATDARGLVIGMGLERRLNEGAIGEYLAARFVSETDTFWTGVQRVPQGGAVILEGNRVSQWIWHGGPYEDLFDLPMEQHVERFLALFDQSLTAAARGNGPVTSQLSGGLDSSSIVCRAAELYRAGKLDRPIGAITARFPGEPHDESPWSRAVEDHTGITAEEVRSQPFDAEDARAWVRSSYQMPIRPNALDTLSGVLTTLHRDGRRILLTGEGGDDWMNGSFAHWPDLFARGRWVSLFRHGARQWPDSPWYVKARRTLYPAVMPLVSPRHREAVLRPHIDFRLQTPDWLRPEWIAQTNLPDRWRTGIARPSLKGLSQKSRYSVFSHGSRFAIAETAFAYAESKGVEVRHPLHDVRLTRFFMGVSGNLLRQHNCRKLMLREAMRGTLPELVRTRTTKAYFVGHTIDTIAELFRDRPPHELLPAKLGWIRPEKIAALQAPFDKWRAEGSSGDLPASPWGPVWFAIATDMWLREAFGME